MRVIAPMVIEVTVAPDEVTLIEQAVKPILSARTEVDYLFQDKRCFPTVQIGFAERDLDSVVAAIKEARKHLYS